MKTIVIDGVEYNLTPKVLFKKGDFVVIQETTYLISEIEGLNVTLSCNGRECLFDIDVLKNARLWTIRDAKDGDVLACNEEILLFKSYSVQGRISVYCWYNGHTNNFFSKEVDDALLTTRNKIYPATKEQRDLLFQKMKEAGYEWNAETRELKKNHVIDEGKAEMDYCFTKMMNGEKVSPAWSKEDEVKINRIVACLENLNVADNDILLKDIDWLKSLKDRAQNTTTLNR